MHLWSAGLGTTSDVVPLALTLRRTGSRKSDFHWLGMFDHYVTARKLSMFLLLLILSLIFIHTVTAYSPSLPVEIDIVGIMMRQVPFFDFRPHVHAFRGSDTCLLGAIN